MKFLIGTAAYNEYWQNMAGALFEADALGAYYTAYVDHHRQSVIRGLRRAIGQLSKRADDYLSRRRITTVPESLIHTRPGWEIARTLAARSGLPASLVDWIFIRSEYGLDRACAKALAGPAYGGFMGIEHGSLAALRQARETGKTGIVVFVSPHAAFRRRWVDAEYERFPELQTPNTLRLLRLGIERDQRRDEEASAASQIMTCSPLIAQTLVESGISPQKIVSVPLGAPHAVDPNLLPMLEHPLKFIYAGPVSVRKGAHHLLSAWKKLGSPKGAELHFYGGMLLPDVCRGGLGENVFFHGSVSREELNGAYRRAAALVFPTLCDGFGAVVTEALAQGLPVLTTPNAGAAALIQDEENGFITPAGDVEALATRLGWCIDHPGALEAMKRPALLTAQRWSWRHFRSAFIQSLNIERAKAA